MSEIKGQLLGIVLVIAIFGVVIGIITAAFQASAQAVQTRMEDVAYTNTEKPDPNARVDAERNYSLHY